VSKKSKNNKRNKNVKLWLEGARLRTLPLAIAPVILGAGSAWASNRFSWTLTLLALAVALFLQIGVNFANDYSDGVRGTDAKRVGPLRLTGSGSTKPQSVKFAAFLFFGLAALAGLGIVLATQLWWLIAIGVICIVAAWFYTGGKSPYGYAGLGEIAVFIFFGLVAVMGTAYIQILHTDLLSPLFAIASGFFASAVLMVNNIRDRELDQHVGKRTLAVKLGATWSKVAFVAMLWLPFVFVALASVLYPTLAMGFAAVLLTAPITLIVLTAKTPKELILVLKLTSFASLGFSLLLLWGIAGVGLI
jgi:1,4-dihydroxy-2-naphthoate octaprenyltransferase